MKCGAITVDGFPLRCDLPQGHESPCDHAPGTDKFCANCGQPVSVVDLRGAEIVTHVYGDVFCGRQFTNKAVLA